MIYVMKIYISIYVFHTPTFQLLDKPWSQVSSLPPRFLPSFFTAHRVQQSHCSSIIHRVLLSASQFVHKKNSLRIYTSMHSGGLELTNVTFYQARGDNLIRHRGDRIGLTAACVLRRWRYYSIFFLSESSNLKSSIPHPQQPNF